MLNDNFLANLNLISNQIGNLLSTPIEHNFERLARLAKRMFNVSGIAICLFDEKRQLAKPVVSFDISQIDLFMPFFNEFNSDDIFVVEDTAKNEQLKTHRLVVKEPNLRFYVSCPIFERHGKKIGSLILFDYKPRTFGLTDLSNLNDIVRLIETEIRNYRLSKAQKLFLQEIANTDRTSFTDELTRAWGYESCLKILNYQIGESQKEKSSFAVAIVDIDHLQEINEKYGQDAGDQVLTLTSSTLLKSCRDEDTIARGKDEDFILIIHAPNIDNIKTVVNRIKDNIAKAEVQLPSGKVTFKATIGVTVFDDKSSTVENLIQDARFALLKGKRLGRNRIEFS
jgi:diguanylate cyclase (GGDEF)-like protein